MPLPSGNSRWGVLLRHGVPVLADAVEVAVHVGLAGVVRGDGEMGRTGLAPLVGMAAPALRRPARELGLGLDAVPVHRQAGVLPVAADDVDDLLRLVGAAERHEAVAEAR